MGFEVGQRIADYEIVALLGVGGMGRVYRVRNVISHRTEAMKVLLADLKAEPELAARFVSEIRTLAGLDHPNIAQLHTAFQAGNELVMMMEFVDGRTLQELAQDGPLPTDEVIDYMHQVLAALSFAHSRGVVHRDIKPANVMVTPQGMVKLMDFGIAKSKAKNELTQPGTTVGSLNYMSPEQAMGASPIDGRADIYSVGITMYELFAGCRPFEDESAYVILHSQLHVAPRPPIEINPLVSEPLNEVILKALEKDPANRFQSAEEFSAALRKATQTASTPAASTPKVRATNAAPLTATVPAVRTDRTAALAASTSRFSTKTPRRLWIAAEVLAILGVPVLTAVGIPHLMKTRAITRTSTQPVAQGPSVSMPQEPVVAAPASPNADTALMESSPIAHNEAAAVAAMASIESRAHAKAEPAVLRGRPSEPRRARVNYQTAALSKATPIAEGDDGAERPTPPLPPAQQGELQKLRDQKLALDTRAAALRITVQRLKSQREAAGDGLSPDLAAAYVRMNAYLGAEKSDLEDGDLASARDHQEKAAEEIGVLENLFRSEAAKEIAAK